MKNKHNGLVLMSVLGITGTLVLGLVVAGAAAPKNPVGGNDSAYTITLNKDNGAQTSEAFSQSETTIYSHTGNGNSIKILSSHSKQLDNGLVTLQSKKGYIKNRDELNGMTSFAITYSFSGDGGKGRLTFSFSDEQNSIELTGDTTQKTDTFTVANGDFLNTATRFFVFAENCDLNIASIVIKYSCSFQDENFSDIKLSLVKERFLVGETLTLSSDFYLSGCELSNVYQPLVVATYTVTNPKGEAIDTSSPLPSSAAGLCSITANHFGTSSNTLQFWVLDEANPVTATSFSLNETTASLSIGGKKTLGYTFAPENTFSTSVSFVSSNPAVATVNEDGMVTALSNGETTITATLASGSLTSSCTITVADTSGYSRTASTQKAHDADSRLAPATGDEKILLVPVALAGTTKYKWNETSYQKFVSLGKGIQNYYSNASCGSMNVTVVVAGTLSNMFTSTYTQEDFYTANSDTNAARRLDLLATATTWVNDNGWPLSGYDNDNNGYVDSIHFMVDGSDQNKWSSNLWPHMDYTNVPAAKEGETPVTNVYSLSNLGHISDAYTTIHEQGHIYGLEDYYDYASGSTADLLGLADMQSAGSFDWNSFSKLQVGWASPYVPSSSLASGDSFSVTLNPSATSGDCLVLGTDWSGSAYGEYILVELFTDSGNNKPFWNKWNHDLGDGGIRIYHVDARLWGYNQASGIDQGAYDKLVAGSSYDTHYLPANNTTDSSYANPEPTSMNPDFHLLELIQKGGFQSYLYNNGYVYLGEDDLFETNDSFCIGDHTGYTDYSSYLKNDGNFNDGDSFNYGIHFDSVTKDSATLTVKLF